MTGPHPGDDADREGAARRRDLAAALEAVRRRIATACATHGRTPAELTLVVVTKTHPATDVRHLAGLGVGDVGESREQELREKRAEIADAFPGEPLRWHFVGRLQTNKARRVAEGSDLVHSVDRESLITPLARGAAASGRRLGVLVQVSLDGDPARGGVPVRDGARALLELADRVAAEQDLRLRGLMAVAPLGGDPQRAFAALSDLRATLLSQHRDADVVSAGMSADLEAAIGAGATHLRVGSAILGARQSLG